MVLVRACTSHLAPCIFHFGEKKNGDVDGEEAAARPENRLPELL